jgi:hypothetical protein
MDEGHLLAAARHAALNPVRAHLAGAVDSYVATRRIVERCGGPFVDLISAEPNIVQMTATRRLDKRSPR